MTDHPMFRQPLPVRMDPAAPRSGYWAGFWRRLRRLLRHVPLIDRTLAAWYCARDPGTPLRARIALFGAIGYFVMPFDAIPDFFPGIGHLDDAAVMLLALRLVAHRITPDHRERARQRLSRWTGIHLPS